MADSKKEDGRDADDHPFDYTDSKKEEAGRHVDEEEAGNDDDDDRPFDCTDSKNEKGHDDDEEEDNDGDGDDDDPFDYNLQLVVQAAHVAWKEDFPDGYPGDGEERRTPQRPDQDCSHGIAPKKKPRSSLKKCSKPKIKRASPPASSPTASNSDDKLMKSSSSSSLGKAKVQESTASTSHTTDSDDHVPDHDAPDYDPYWNIDLLADVATDICFEETSEAAPPGAVREQRWDVLRSTSRRTNANSGEGTSTHRRLQRDLAAGADLAADNQPPPPPAAPQARRTWREVHREMGGGEVVRIGKKTVHKSDKSKHQSRLLLPHGLEAKVFKHVSWKEKKKIKSDAGMQVEVLDFYGQRFEMKCKYRVCHKGMVFNSGWTRFLREHETSHLREYESLLLFAFRSPPQRLCFVFVPQHLQNRDQRQHPDDQYQVIDQH